MLTTRSRASGISRASAAATGGTSAICELSAQASVSSRVDERGSNTRRCSIIDRSWPIAAASSGSNSSAAGVGAMPRPSRTSSGSPSSSRALASAFETADCVTPSRRAARVALLLERDREDVEQVEVDGR